MNGQEKKPRRRVKKVKGGGGHHGGAWKVAYADFITAMMALFLVLWLVSQADTKLKQAIANYFRAPGVFDSMQGGIIEGPRKVSKEPSPLTSKEEEQARFSTAAILRRKFETRPEFSKYKEQIKIDVTDEGLRIQILDEAERFSFPSGSAELTPEARDILAEIARGVCELPNPVHVGGHTDRQPYSPGSAYTNWELSADRANAARRALEAGCVRPEQVQRIIGFADTQLFTPSDPFAASNRRITITVMRLGGTGIPPEGNRPEPAGGRDGKSAGPPKPAAQTLSPADLGEPDKIPEGVTRTREKSPPKTPPDH